MHDRTTSARWFLNADSFGELGNQLVIFCWLLAHAFERHAAITNLGLWRYARFFDLSPALIVRPWKGRPSGGTDHLAGLFRLLRKMPLLERWVQRRCHFDGEIVFDAPSLKRRALAFAFKRLANDRLGRAALEKVFRFPEDRYSFVTLRNSSCPAGDPAIIERHAAAIRHYLCPRADIREQVASFLAPLRVRHRTLVGVHIRRGDYRIYREGRWFFEDSVYRDVMERFATLLGPDTAFVIASNDTIRLADFSPLIAIPAPGHLMLDMFALAGCDYITGPPSTFSGCASYFGGKPIFWLTDVDARPANIAALKQWLPQFY